MAPPLFTLLQLERPTDGVRSGRCDESPMPRSHQTFCPVLAVDLLGIMLRSRCWPATLHTITTGEADGWCLNWPVWLAPHDAPITPTFPSGSSRGFVGDYVEK